MSRYDGRFRDDSGGPAFNGGDDAMSRVGLAEPAHGSLAASELDPQLLKLPIVSLMSWLSMQSAPAPVNEAAAADIAYDAGSTCPVEDLAPPPDVPVEPEILHAPYQIPVSFEVLPSTVSWSQPAAPAPDLPRPLPGANAPGPERRVGRKPVAYRLATLRLRAMQRPAVAQHETPVEAVAGIAGCRQAFDLAAPMADMPHPEARSAAALEASRESPAGPCNELEHPHPGQGSLLLATDRASWLLSLQRRGGPD